MLRKKTILLALLLAGFIAGRTGAEDVKAARDSAGPHPLVTPDSSAGGVRAVPAATSLRPYFQPGRAAGEQNFDFDFGQDIFIHINASVPLTSGKPLLLILSALPQARNGLIHSALSGTGLENRGYRYWGEPADEQWIGSGSQFLPVLTIPARAAAALTGSQFIAKIDSLSPEAREEAIWQELRSGNLPDFLRCPVLLEKKWADAAGDSHQVVFAALPDYLAIGSDADFVRMPMTPSTAQRTADFFGAILPTRKLVDALYQTAEVKLAPQPILPVGSRNELPGTFMQHQQDIESQWAAVEGRRGVLTAGHKKDIVLSTRLIARERFGRVVIYGWHKPDGQPIQPLTDVHVSRYVDYSHGVRLLVNQVLIDGVARRMAEILSDPLLHSLLSDEEGVMTQTRYDAATENGPDR